MILTKVYDYQAIEFFSSTGGFNLFVTFGPEIMARVSKYLQGGSKTFETMDFENLESF